MKKLRWMVPCFGFLSLILDSRCAARAAAASLRLCLQTVIPSLFPLFVCAALVMPALASLPVPRWLGRLLRIPEGTEGIFLLGAVGGFPLGARCINQAVQAGQLAREDGQRMLGFCDNCGIAFLFGILPTMFRRPETALLCFLIQLECAVLIARFRPGNFGQAERPGIPEVSLGRAVRQSIQAMATVCAWILLTGVCAGFLQKWVLWILPPLGQLIARGMLELTSGCLGLREVEDEGLRMILCCGFLNFGSISVLFQIHAVAEGLSMRPCILQKLSQSVLAMLLALGTVKLGPFFLLLPILPVIFFKKQWNFPSACGIIPVKREVSDHAVS